MAKAKAGNTTRRGRNALREKAAQQRRRQTLMLGGGAALVVLFIGYIVYLQVQSSLPVVGEESLASLGNTHIEFGSQYTNYNSTPPTSGPHYDNIVGWGIYNEPQRYEHLLHNLEDGGVVIYYQCADGCPEVVAQLEAIAQPLISSGEHVVLAPNDPTWSPTGGAALHQDMGAMIALTAWQRILKLDEVDEATIRTFVERYEGLDHHVPGIG